jgi:hypothetical protein
MIISIRDLRGVKQTPMHVPCSQHLVVSEIAVAFDQNKSFGVIYMRFVLLIVTLILVPEAFACSCGGPDIQRMHEKAEVVFVGKIKSKGWFYSLTNNRFQFQNLDTFKGPATKQVEVWSSKMGSACGIDFRKDQKYVVFAFKEGDRLWASRCSSWPIDSDRGGYTRKFRDFYEQEAETGLE